MIYSAILQFIMNAVLLGVILFIVLFVVLFIRNYRRYTRIENEIKNAFAKINESKLVRVEELPNSKYAMYDALTGAFLVQADTVEQLTKIADTMFSNLLIVK